MMPVQGPGGAMGLRRGSGPTEVDDLDSFSAMPDAAGVSGLPQLPTPFQQIPAVKR